MNHPSSEILMRDMHLAQDELASKVFNVKLAALRAQNPFLPIVSIPDKTVNLSLAINTAQDCPLPSGVKMIMIRRLNPDTQICASLNGNAQFIGTITANTNENDSGSFVINDNIFMYVEELQSISFVSNTASQLSVMCWSQL
jgi:hypothetical protein